MIVDLLTGLTALACVLYEWQTLATGVLALLAAWWTVCTIQKQIVLQRRQLTIQKQQFLAEQKNREASSKSKNWAARARLPDALSAVGSYAKGTLEQLLNKDYSYLPSDRPTAQMDEIKFSIEHADPVSAKAIYDLVVHYQIFNSRQHWITSNSDRNAIAQRCYDAILLRCLCDRLFTYARNKEEVVGALTITNEMMISALTSCVGIDTALSDKEVVEDTRRLIAERHSDEK